MSLILLELAQKEIEKAASWIEVVAGRRSWWKHDRLTCLLFAKTNLRSAVILTKGLIEQAIEEAWGK